MSSNDVLAGRRILVVEDEFLTADEIIRTLRSSGAEVLGAVPTVDGALALIGATPSLDAAIIDVKLAGELAYPVAEALVARATPFVFSTVYRRDELPLRFRQTPHSAKPMQPRVLLATLREALDRARPDAGPPAAGPDEAPALSAAAFPASSLPRWIRSIAHDRDRQAFGELFLAVAPKVKGYMLRFGMPAPVAEALAQDVMLTIWRKSTLFDPSRGSVMAWIFTIARDARTDWIRREYPGSAQIDWNSPPPPATPEEIFGGGDADSQRMHEALRGLPKAQAEVLRRSFLYSEPHPEIARALGVPLGTVKSRLRIAMARLRAKMGDDAG